jgi:hypothetical protein
MSFAIRGEAKEVLQLVQCANSNALKKIPKISFR